MKVERNIRIDAPPQRVYDVVMDPGRLKDWVTIHDHLEDAPSGSLKQGSKLTQSLRLAGRKFKVRWTVVENDPCKRVVWEGHGPVGSHARVMYEFGDSSNHESTDFHYTNWAASPAMAWRVSLKKSWNTRCRNSKPLPNNRYSSIKWLIFLTRNAGKSTRA